MERERPRSPLDDMAERIAEVINAYSKRRKIKPSEVDLAMVADFCWALGLEISATVQAVARPQEPTP